MEGNEKIKVTSHVNGTVGVSLTSRSFRREWRAKNQSIVIPYEVLEEAIYDPGFRNMIDQGILSIDNLEAAIELGLEPDGVTKPVNHVVYDDTEFYQRGTTSYVGSLVGVSYGATANVYGGYGESAKGGIIVMSSGGTINVEGGEWIADTGLTGSKDNYSVLIAQNDKISYPSAGKSVVNVTGGTFSGKYNCYGNEVGDSEINISGGKYSEEPTAYLAEGYQALYLENLDYWTVTKKWKVNVDASDNELYEGETVTITVSFDGEKYSNAGYTLTWDTDLFEYVADSLTPHAKDVSEAEVEKHSDLVDDEGNMLWDDYIDYEKGVIKNVILSEDGDDVFNVDGNDVVATYTFKAKAQEKEEDCYYAFVLDSAYANNKEMASSIDSVPALIGDAEKVTIKLRETTIKVMLGGTTELVADTEGKYRFDYNGYEQEVSVVVTNPATGDYETLEYSIDGGSTWTVDAPKYTEVNEYTFSYRINAIDGYANKEGSITVVVEEPEYKIEVVNNKKINSGSADYITDYTMILVYTHTDNAYFTYGENANVLYDVTAAGYKYTEYDEDGTAYTDENTTYKYVYGIIVPAINVDTMAKYEDRVAAYKANVKFTSAATPVVIDKEPRGDVNNTNKVDINDLTATFCVYNGDETYVPGLMEVMLRADVNGDKMANALDAIAVKDEAKLKI